MYIFMRIAVEDSIPVHSHLLPLLPVSEPTVYFIPFTHMSAADFITSGVAVALMCCLTVQLLSYFGVYCLAGGVGVIA